MLSRNYHDNEDQPRKGQKLYTLEAEAGAEVRGSLAKKMPMLQCVQFDGGEYLKYWRLGSINRGVVNY